MTRLQEKIADGSVLSLIESFLKASILDGLEKWTPATGTARRGAEPAVEQHLPRSARPPDGASGYEMVRYADDFVILCRTPEEASPALETVQRGYRKTA